MHETDVWQPRLDMQIIHINMQAGLEYRTINPLLAPHGNNDLWLQFLEEVTLFAESKNKFILRDSII